MNVQDIVTRVRRTFGDEAAVQVTDDDIIRWINDGQVEIVKENDGALQTTSYISLVANQSTYTLPTDLLLLRALRYKYDDMQSYSTLKYMSMQQFDESVDGWDGTLYGSSSPVFFTTDVSTAILFPTPDRATTNGLKVLYNKKPTVVDDLTDALDLPLIYHNTVMSYCLYQASLLDEDLEPAVMYKNEFDQSVGKLKGRERKDSTSFYPTITTLDYDL